MLFDALLQRALGQKFARQDIDPSAPNRSISSKVFFAKFPNLRGYLLDQLTRDVTLLESNEVKPLKRILIAGYFEYWIISNPDVDFTT